MNTFKVFFRFVLLGALLIGTLTSYLAPKMIAWYFDPPVNIGVNCKAATEWAMSRLQLAQLIGLLTGAVIGFIVWWAFSSRNKKSPDTI